MKCAKCGKVLVRAFFDGDDVGTERFDCPCKWLTPAVTELLACLSAGSYGVQQVFTMPPGMTISRLR